MSVCPAGDLCGSLSIYLSRWGLSGCFLAGGLHVCPVMGLSEDLFKLGVGLSGVYFSS